MIDPAGISVFGEGFQVFVELCLVLLCCCSEGALDVLDCGADDPFGGLEIFLGDDVG